MLEETARESGADVIGVADIGRFHGLPPEKHPQSIFPEARSVIVLGRRITRGTLRGVEEGTNFLDYALYGYDWLDNRFVALTTRLVSEYLEDNGWEAVPLPNLPPEIPPMGVPVRPGQPAPNVMLDFDDAAVRAGVGEIGYPDVLVTPEFGPRQRIQMILTDAELEPSPILEDEVCTRDPELGDLCPLGALKGEREMVVCGKSMRIADVDYEKCAGCRNGAKPNMYHPAGRPDRLAAVCVRSYVDHLEKNGRLTKTFNNPFRKRKPWEIANETDWYRTMSDIDRYRTNERDSAAAWETRR
jgi:epoxyqueuosine reductase QueG